jgi:hypothetical protein
MNETSPPFDQTGTGAPSDVAAAARWDLVLYWMSSLGEGSWDRFRSVISELSDADRDLSQLRRTLRVTLSDFGHVNFFIRGSSRWETLPPLLIGLVAHKDTALLVGARTPSLIAALRVAATRHGAEMRCETKDDSPALIRLEGPPSTFGSCAAAAGILYADAYAWRLAAALRPIPSLFERTRRDTDRAPINWSSRSFQLHSRGWVDGVLPRSACEFVPRYGRPRYFVANRRRRLFEIQNRRDAIYAAAHAEGISLATYEPANRTLSVPVSAPLPEDYARVACLCSGQRAEVQQGWIVYQNMPNDLASVLLTALGQPRAPRVARTQES